MQGSENNPIELLDDDEEIRANQQKVEYQRNRQALYQAHMGSQFDVLMAVIKLEIKGTDEEKNRVLKSRILKFFNHGSKSINVESEYFRKRRQPDYSDPSTVPTNNQLIMYGVDFLNAKQVRLKFAGLNVEVEWLDDSHCKVKFEDADQARRGLEMNLKNKSDDMVKIENEDLQIPKGWFQLKPYNYMTLQRRLFVRYAASNQNQLQIQKSNDFWMYQQAKKKFEESIREEVTELRYYEVMRKYKLINEGRLRERMSNRNNRQFNNNREDRGYRQNYNRRDQGYGGARNRDEEGGFSRNRNNYRMDREDNFRFNNRAYGYKRGERDGQQERNPDYERSRNKDKKNNNDDLDNLSLVSQPVSHSSKRPRRQRNASPSICSQESPVRQKNEDDDAKSSYSFIFNLNQENSNSNQIVNNFNNLSINDMQQQPNFSKKNGKLEDLNLSIIQNQKNPRNQQNELNFSVNLGDDTGIRKKKDLNTSIAMQDPTPRPNTKMNTSIEQITIYD